jgi:hypothetical protein
MSERTKEDIAFLRGCAWPFYPACPVKRPAKIPGEWPEVAILFRKRDDKYIIYEGNLFTKPDGNRCILGEYDSAEAVVNAGWVVD